MEGGGDLGEGFDGEVLVGALYAGDYGLGGAYGFGELGLGSLQLMNVGPDVW